MLLKGTPLSQTLLPTLSTESDPWSGLEHLVVPLQLYLTRRCGCTHDVQDALQETLIRAARYRRPGIESTQLRSWTYTIAANVLRDQSSKRMRGPSVGHDEALFDRFGGREPDPSVPDDRAPLKVGDRWVEMEQLITHLTQAMGELPDADRLALLSYYENGGSTLVASKALRLNQSLVKVRLFRARHRLRRRIELSLARKDRAGRLLVQHDSQPC